MNSRLLFLISTVILLVALFAGSSEAQSLPNAAQASSAQSAPEENTAPLDDVAVSPSRLELVMAPGTERTVVVNTIYNVASADAPKIRLRAYPGDWNLTKTGQIEFFKPGTQPNSAASWMIYSPAEPVALPGQSSPIRVTITVPKDAAPGDHLAALFIEPRPDNLKLEISRRQMRMSFRMAVIFYIQVPQLTQKPSLQNLRAESNAKGIVVIPTFKNEGNSHVRPLHYVRLLDSTGSIAAEIAETELLPVLGGSEISMPVVLEKKIPAGVYSVQYRVNFRDGNPLTEGRTTVTVRDHLVQSSEGTLSITKNQETGKEQK
jgi:methionine-rich copper-binding protein CopC